ncbi:MAG: hypothetical protein DWH99_14615 [Planctomycetota bacterium]|nr:MAG: hypothetical protein DWH99_14615 [Planctomycetota bacterium]
MAIDLKLCKFQAADKGQRFDPNTVSQGGASLCPGLSHFAPLGRWGSMVDRAIPEAKQPKSQTAHALGGTFRGR